MKMNRVQFQPGLSMAEFLERYGSDEQCEAALLAARWPSGFVCPACGGTHSSSFRRAGRPYFQCTACRHQCSLTSGTIFEATKLGLSRWFLAMHLLTQSKNNVAALELMRHLGVCYKTAWTIKHKLMEVMRMREDARQLEGRVELDDAYLGGERSGGRAGRGSENKVPFVAAVQTTPGGQPQLVCLRQQPFTREEVAVFAARSIAPSATVVSDGLWCFGAVQIVGAEHERVVTGGGKASTRLPQFKAVNTFLGNLKRSLSGTYHAFDFSKYAHRYLAEAQYRFNRRFDLSSSRPATAGAVSPGWGTPYIVPARAYSTRLRGRLSSNVERQLPGDEFGESKDRSRCRAASQLARRLAKTGRWRQAGADV